MPEVSIIIPTYNRANLLKKTLQSVLAQTYSDYEVIVIANGSTDNTESVIQEFKNNKIKFIFQEGSGSPASPRNRGINMAIGKYIAFCDDDDLWMPEKLEKQRKFLKNNQEYSLCYTYMKRFDNTKEWINIEDNKTVNANNCLLYKNNIPLSSLMIRRDVLQGIELFDEDKKIAGAEDYELLLRLMRCNKIFCLQEHLLLYYSGQNRFSNLNSASFLKVNINYLIRLFYVYKKVVGKGYVKWHEVLLPFSYNCKVIIKIIIYHFIFYKLQSRSLTAS